MSLPRVLPRDGHQCCYFFKWRSKYGGMDPSIIAHMKEFETENARLKKIYIEEKLKAEMLNEAITNK